jgi:hypothetical protein
MVSSRTIDSKQLHGIVGNVGVPVSGQAGSALSKATSSAVFWRFFVQTTT